MIEWKRKIFFLEFALQMSTFLADIYIMIELKQEIFFLVFALQTFTFLADIYIMIELKQEIFCLYLHYRHSLFSWHLYYDRVKANNNISFAHSFNTPYNLFHSLSYSFQNKKPPCFHRTGKRQIIEGEMTESKFLSPPLFISFWFVYSNGSVLLYS